MSDLDNPKEKTSLHDMASSLNQKIVQIVLVITGFALLFWVTKKISGTTALFVVGCAIVVGLVWDELTKQQEKHDESQSAIVETNLQTAVINERSNQYLLAGHIEQKRTARWQVLSKAIGSVEGLVGLVLKYFHNTNH